MELEDLIKIVVEEVMKRLGQEQQEKPGKALIMFTGARIALEEACAGIRAMREAGWETRVFMSASAERVIQDCFLRDRLQMDEILCESKVTSLSPIYEGIDLAIIPSLTLNSMAKLALGIADTAVTNIVSHLLMANTPIIAARDACDLDHPSRERLGLGLSLPPYKRLYECYREMLVSYGVCFVDTSGIWEAVKDFQACGSASGAFPKNRPASPKGIESSAGVFAKNILTRIDLLEGSRNGEIVVGEHVRVTDAARDTALQMKIKIVRG